MLMLCLWPQSEVVALAVVSGPSGSAPAGSQGWQGCHEAHYLLQGYCRKAYHASLAQKEAIISSGSTSDGPIGSRTRTKKYKLKTSNPLKSAHQQRNDVAPRFCMILPIKLSPMPGCVKINRLQTINFSKLTD